MPGGGRGAVPNGHDGAPPGGWRSEISTSISQESQEITQGRAHALLQLPGVGCVESTPNPEAVTCQEGPGVAPPVGRGLRALSSDSPRRCREAGEAPSGCVGGGQSFQTATEQPREPQQIRRTAIGDADSWVHHSWADFAGDDPESACSSCFPNDLGALICALKNPGKYKSVSAFAPLCNPVLCRWGKKAFTGYLGTDQSKWEAYDATYLVKSYPGPQLDILIDQGKEDEFLSDGQLLPDNFIAACTEKKIPVVFRLQEGYDHSYYFIATFIADHIRHHAKYLNA